MPWPARSGNHLRDLQTLLLLEKLGYDVEAVAGSRGPSLDRSLGPQGRLLTILPVADEGTAPTARAQRALRLLSSGGAGRPGPWALAYEAAGVGALVERILAERRPALFATRLSLAHLVQTARRHGARVLLDAHDSELLLARSLAEHARGLARIGAALRIRAARRLEAVAAEADETWVPTEREAQELRRAAPRARVLVVPNGIPVPDAPSASSSGTCELLLVAGFGYPPNDAAARRLVEGVLPLVRARVPEASVTLVGRDLSPELQARWRDLPVRWLGVVDDLDAVYERAAVVVVPLPDATVAGSPLKIAEAAAHGRAIVTTPVVAERTGAPDDVFVTGKSDAELSEAVASLLRDQDAATRLGARAHAWAREQLAPDALAERVRAQSCLG